MSNKHPKPSGQTADLPGDLDENPGIGQSKGLFAREEAADGSLIEGDNTSRGTW